MVKIYVQNKPLFLVDEIKGEAADHYNRPGTVFLDKLNSAAVSAMLQRLEQPGIAAGVFLHAPAGELLDAFTAHLTPVTASGGLVYTPDDHVLLIFRKGKWDLPKGKLEEGEDLEACALREIEEETGAAPLTIEKPLQVSYHTYYEKEKQILKASHWFLVSAPSAMPLAAQTEEDIERCDWVPLNELPRYMGNMHASIVDVITTWLDTVKK